MLHSLGSRRPEVVLKLIKSLYYGLKQAPLHWFEWLHDGLLLKRVEDSSRVNWIPACLFYKRRLILVLATHCSTAIDDCPLVFGSEQGDLIDEEIRDLEKEFDLRDEGDVGAFLGINIARLKDRRFELSTQPSYLIESQRFYVYWVW